MKPLEHAQKDVATFGGVVEDYLPVHDFFDQTKAFMPDMRHRAVLHNAWGIFLCERMLGPSITNRDGRVIATRTIAERHVMQDLKFIPTFEQCFGDLPFHDWLTGKSDSFRAVLVDALLRERSEHGDDEP
jgi:hypothetical protein